MAWALRYSITSGARNYCHLGRKVSISNLGSAVQHNFRRTLLVPSREENISSLSTSVQHNFRRTLLVSFREENISSLGAAVQHNLAPKYIGC